MFKKNTAVTGFQIGHFIGVADGVAVTTGTPSCKRLLDGTAGSLTNAAAYDGTAGVWKIDLAAADLNADMVGLSFTLAACLPISYTIKTTAKLVSELADFDSATDTVSANMTAISGDTTAADRLEAILDATPTGTVVNDADPVPTTLLFETNLTETTNDHYNGAFVVFYTGALLGQSRKISDYDGTTKVVSVAMAFTEAPTAGDLFMILGRSE